MNDLPRALVDYEHVIRAAARRQISDRQRRRRRLATSLAVALPAVLAVGVAGAETAAFTSIGSELGLVRDTALSSPARPSDRTAESWMTAAAGEGPRDPSSTRQWTIDGHRFVGFTSANGDFCTNLGGCLQPGTLSDAMPLATTVGYGPGVFQVFGLAIDGVTSVRITVGSTTGDATMGPNSFYYENDALGGTAGFQGTATATMQDGTTREIPIHVSAFTSSG
jgi:hypothetical protein